MKATSRLCVSLFVIGLATSVASQASESTATSVVSTLPCDTSVALASAKGFVLGQVGVRRDLPENFKGISDKELQESVKFLADEYARVLGTSGKLSPKTEPGVVRIDLSLVDIKGAKPVLSTAMHVMPIGLLMNIGKQTTGHKGSCMGSVSYECRLTDATTGRLLACVLVNKAPAAMDMGAAASTSRTIHKSITAGAEEFLKEINLARSTTVSKS